jgi:hypothetical protein
MSEASGQLPLQPWRRGAGREAGSAPLPRYACHAGSLRAGVGEADCGPSEHIVSVWLHPGLALEADKGGSSVQPNRHTSESAPESALMAPRAKLVVVHLWWLEKAPLRACARFTCKSPLF